MSNVRFCADLHLGHENMAINRGFNNVEEHYNYIIEQWNKVVHKKDTVFIVGDVTMENRKHYYKLGLLNGRKVVVLGNHDRPEDITELLKYVDKVVGMLRYSQKGYKKVFITHCPIHPRELEYRVGYNIHGHLHEEFIKLPDGTPDPRYICVSCEHINYQPKLFTELVPYWNKD